MPSNYRVYFDFHNERLYINFSMVEDSNRSYESLFLFAKKEIERCGYPLNECSNIGDIKRFD